MSHLEHECFAFPWGHALHEEQCCLNFPLWQPEHTMHLLFNTPWTLCLAIVSTSMCGCFSSSMFSLSSSRPVVKCAINADPSTPGWESHRLKAYAATHDGVLMVRSNAAGACFCGSVNCCCWCSPCACALPASMPSQMPTLCNTSFNKFHCLPAWAAETFPELPSN